MKKKNYLTLVDEFIQYCQINNIEDIDLLAQETFKRGFAILKYGEVPFNLKGSEKIIEKEVIKEIPVDRIIEKEVIKEIPVEKIVQVEVIKEVPIDKEAQVIIQEVIKEVKVKDDDEINALREENKKLKDELATITASLEKFSKAMYLKNSNLSNLYGE